MTPFLLRIKISPIVPVYLEGRHTLHIFYVLTFVEMAEPDEGSTNKADSESEDECEVLEESPCGRWQKRREEVKLVDQKEKTNIKCNIDILKLKKKSHRFFCLFKTLITTFKRFLFSCKQRICKLKCYSFVHILDKGTTLPVIECLLPLE